MDVEGGRVVVSLEGRDVGLETLINKIEKGMRSGATAAKEYQTEMRQLDSTTAASNNATAAYYQSLARVAVGQKDYAGATRILATALKNDLIPGTVAANNAQQQLQRTIDQTAIATKNANSPLTNLSKSIQGMIGAYFAVTQAAQLFTAAIGEANALEKQKATFEALSGSAEKYKENMEVVKKQQELFGGSLKDNIDGLSGFANLSNRTGIELNELANIARRLAIIDPVQGFKGASIALKEFFSGDITSLARRFEISRKELNNIKGLDNPAEQMAALDAVLEKLGISQELLTAQTQTTAVAYDKLAGAATDAFAATGTFLAEGLRVPAEALTGILRQVTDGLNFFSGQSAKVDEVSASFLSGAGSLEAYNARVAQFNQQLNSGAGLLAPFATDMQQLTATQYQAAIALQAQGYAYDEIIQKINEAKGVSDNFNTVQQDIADNTGATASQLTNFGTAMIEAATYGQQGIEAANGYLWAVQNESIGIDQATQLLYQYIAGKREAAGVVREVTEATAEGITYQALFTDELIKSSAENINAQIQSEALKLKQEQLYSAALAAALGMGNAQAAASAMASEFGIATGEAYNLISALRQLDMAKAAGEVGKLNLPTNVQGYFGGMGSKEIADIKAAGEARNRYNYAILDTAGKLQYQQKALKGLSSDSAAYAEKQLDIYNLQKQLNAEQEREAKKGKKGGGGASPKLSDAEKLNNKLLSQQDQFNNKFEEAEIKHLQKIADINEDAAKKLLEQQQKNEVGKRRSRADFYGSIADAMDAGVDTGPFTAAFEEAFAAAQTIAQNGQARLSAEFLALRQNQINELLDLEKEAADIRNDDDLDEKTKSSRLEYLQGRKGLIEDAQREELQQLMNGGDALQNELTERLSAEEEAYMEQAEKIGRSASNKADLLVANAEREKKAVDATNLSYAEQLRTLGQIENVSGGTVPGSATSTPTSTITAAEPIPIDTSIPVPVSSVEALLVRQQDMWFVRDQGVIDTLADMTARLEGKLEGVIQSVNTAADRISGAVSSINNSVNRRDSALVTTG